MKRFFFILYVVGFCEISFSQSPPPPIGIWVFSECDATSDYYQFDLTEAIPSYYIGDTDPTNYNVSFYETEEDAMANTSPITNPTDYTNLTVYQTIYALVEYIPTNYIFIRESYIIIEEPIVAINPTTLIGDCSSSDGFSIFDLRMKDLEILGGMNSESFTVFYYETEEDALNNENRLASTYTNIVPYNQTIYAAIGRYQTQCRSNIIVGLDLVVSNVLCEDLAVYLYPQTPPRPGFDHNITVFLKNEGPADITEGNVTFNFDGLMNYINYYTSDSGLTISQAGQSVSIDFADINSNSGKTVAIEFNVPTSVSLGTLLEHDLSYTTNSSDAITQNDTYNLIETVVGSYDPNDILESRGEEIDIDNFDSDAYLYYTVRFQNVGTAEAINISIENTLDTQLDLSTIKMLNSSHANSFLRSGGQLTWTFDNINLPSESMDEPNSHGFVHYRIKPNPGFAVNDIIPNTAEIYFDFNAPVITNTFETKFVDKRLSNDSFDISGFNMHPNPANEIVTLDVSFGFKGDFLIAVYDIHGKMILQLKDEYQIDVSNVQSGLYFVQIDYLGRSMTEKLIIN